MQHLIDHRRGHVLHGRALLGGQIFQASTQGFFYLALANLFGSSRAAIVNSTFTGNSADGAGGALSIAAGTAYANNSILSGNTAPAGANVSGTLGDYGLASNLLEGPLGNHSLRHLRI